MSKMSSFIQGYGLGERMGNSYRAASDRNKIREIADAKPEQSQGFTAEDGQQLEAMAAAKDEQGQSFYLVGTDDKGNYTVTPNPAASGMQEQAGAPVTIAQKGVTDFLGERTAGTLSPEQVMGAKQKAMGEVIMARDPIAGMRMQREQLDNQRSDQRFGWEKSRAERDERTAAQAEADQGAQRELDADVGTWMGQRLKNPDGSARTATVDDHLAATQYRAGKLMSAGKVAEAGQAMKDYQAQSFVKIQMETAQRDEALGKTIAAVNAGNIEAIAPFYNQYMPDGAKITGVKRDEKGKVTIERATEDGLTMPPMVLQDVNHLTAVLSSLKDPQAVYKWTQGQFQNNMALRADARADRADGRAARADARAAASQGRSQAEAKALADSRVALLKERDPNASPAQIEAVRTGAMEVGTSNKNSPSEVKLATAMVEAGLAPDMRTGLEMAITKKSQSAKETYIELMKPQGGMYPKEADISVAMETAYGADWKSKVGGSASARVSSGKVQEAPKVNSPSELAKLPNGARYTAPDGSVRIKQ